MDQKEETTEIFCKGRGESVWISVKMLKKLASKYHKSENYIKKVVEKTIEEGVEESKGIFRLKAGSRNNYRISVVHMVEHDFLKGWYIVKMKLKRKITLKKKQPKLFELIEADPPFFE